MNNGCVCCTVRGDLINILHKLKKRKAKQAIIIETTGLADRTRPKPSSSTTTSRRASTASSRSSTPSIGAHLDEVKVDAENEAVGKSRWQTGCCRPNNLLPEERDLRRVEGRLKGLTARPSCAARMRRWRSRTCSILAPSSWSVCSKRTLRSSVDAEHGHSPRPRPRRHGLRRGCTDASHDPATATATSTTSNATTPIASTPATHTPRRVTAAARWARHDSRVSSVGFRPPGELDMAKTNEWIGKLLQEKGQDTTA